jgi:hypothetical protein
MTYREIYIARHCKPTASLESMRQKPVYATHRSMQALTLRQRESAARLALVILPGVNVKASLGSDNRPVARHWPVDPATLR